MEFINFANINEIIDYLNTNKEKIVEESAVYAINAFASPITDEPSNMMQVHRWFDVETSLSLGFIVRTNLNLLEKTDLNLYKLRIICNLRGPSTMEEFIDKVSNDIDNDTIQRIGIHKDFPTAVKELLYTKTHDPRYLSREAQDIFVF